MLFYGYEVTDYEQTDRAYGTPKAPDPVCSFKIGPCSYKDVPADAKGWTRQPTPLTPL